MSNDKEDSISFDDFEEELDRNLAMAADSRNRVSLTMGTFSLLVAGALQSSIVKNNPNAARDKQRYEELKRHVMAKFLDSIDAMVDERVALALKRKHA